MQAALCRVFITSLALVCGFVCLGIAIAIVVYGHWYPAFLLAALSLAPFQIARKQICQTNTTTGFEIVSEQVMPSKENDSHQEDRHRKIPERKQKWMVCHFPQKDQHYSPVLLPSRAAFDAFHGNLDAYHAWENFGGLTVEAAFEKFKKNPNCYQEDFMFMGGVAFAFYYPVIERYILESHVGSDEDFELDALSILGSVIRSQFAYDTNGYVEHLRPRMISLANHVQNNLAQYAVNPDEQKRIKADWRVLESQLFSESIDVSEVR